MIFNIRYNFEVDNVKKLCKEDMIQIEAVDSNDAAKSFMRYYRSRQRNVPEHFGELWSVKISVWNAHRISENGEFLSPIGITTALWRVDDSHGLSFPAFIEEYYALR